MVQAGLECNVQDGSPLPTDTLTSDRLSCAGFFVLWILPTESVVLDQQQRLHLGIFWK